MFGQRHNSAMLTPASITPPSSHIYARDIVRDEHTSLNLLAAHIPAGSMVLDLGCGTGALGRWLQTHGDCTVDGVTLSSEEAQAAQASYRQVVVGNLETITLDTHFSGQRYDFIVCADVLEHLAGPERILAQCRTLLAPQGALLVSVPNASYAGLIAELMQGRFDYRDEGLLDRTHLRFFTRGTLLEFLNNNGWPVQRLDPVHRELHASEFTTAFDSLPPAVARHLLTAPDALSYQLVTCSRLSAASSADKQTLQAISTDEQPRFSAELFIDCGLGYNQNSKCTATGVIGQAHQTLIFEVPQHAQKLRLDPANRPGFLHLHALRLIGADGQKTYEWKAAIDGPLHPEATQAGNSAAQHNIHWLWNLPSLQTASPLLVLLNDDPWLELPVAADILQATATQAGAKLEIDMGWPMSADYLAAASGIAQMRSRLEQAEALRQQQEASALAIQQQMFQQQQHLSQINQQAQQQIEQLSERCADTQQQKQALQQRQSALQQRQSALQQERQLLQREHQQLLAAQQTTQSQLAQLQQHLQWIENSTVFRMTRPLVRLKMALQGNSQQPTPAPTPTPTPMGTAVHPIASTAYPVDVIVPVYKGLADTQLCITSALASVCATPMRLIIINDASPEPAVTTWLREIATSDERIVLLENPDNLGFVGTVNRGMAYSQNHDVLLLNSDTEVANNWLDRLRTAAYSDRKVASVTPFSNNATICSYPRFCEPNPLVDGNTTASLDALCAQLHAGRAIDVPTGIGFCMYIRRDCLNEVGLFDVENFGKGYGEENDFCRRAHDAGWRNLHALDTFVLHSGGVSFGASKSAREIAAMETLRRLHPSYETAVMRFIEQDPAQPFRHSLDLARLANSPLPTVLAVTHNRGGGTLRHVQELAKTLHQKANFLVLTPIPGGKVALERLGQHEGLRLEFNVAEQWDAMIATLQAAKVVQVHFHHTLGHNPRVLGIAQALDVPFDFTAHDHYSYCPQISLTDATSSTNSYCGEKGPEQCQKCLQKSPAPGGADIDSWRQNSVTFLREARHILTPSKDMAGRMARLLPDADVRSAPHTDIEPSTALPEAAPWPRTTGAPLKVLVIGAMSTIKGADVLEDLAVAAAQAHAPIDLHLVGYAYRDLKKRPKANLTVHGAYQDEDLPRMLQWLQPDVVWFPALWPETYSYTLSACLQAGLPVVAPDIGAFPERLYQRPWSWVMPWDTTTDQWLAFFNTLLTDNFSPNTPPAPPTVITPPSAAPKKAWDYNQDYLRTSPPKANASNNAADAAEPIATVITADWLHTYRAGQQAPGIQAVATGARRMVLGALLRLRSAPGLRWAAQKIPLRWQTKVKSWLVR